MPYAVLQKDLARPSIEQLKAAFREVPGLTQMDAYTLGRDAFGIIVRGFPIDRAEALKSALAAQGVETEVMDQASLPELPPVRYMRQLDCRPEALMLYDPLNRSFPLEWKNVLMIAAGKVWMEEFIRTKASDFVPQDRPKYPLDALFHDSFRAGLDLSLDSQTGQTGGGFRTKEERHERLLLEIIISGAGLRYSVEADKAAGLLFLCLGDRRTNDLAANFSLLIQDLTKYAPKAAINQGAYYLRENAAQPFSYPSKTAFYEEIVWLLWQMSENKPDQSG